MLFLKILFLQSLGRISYHEQYIFRFVSRLDIYMKTDEFRFPQRILFRVLR